jgi:hypothetical protein
MFVEFDSCLTYDFQKEIWENQTVTDHHYKGASCHALIKDNLFFFGGGYDCQRLEKFNFKSLKGELIEIKDAPEKRSFATSVSIGEKMIVFGGKQFGAHLMDPSESKKKYGSLKWFNDLYETDTVTYWKKIDAKGSIPSERAALTSSVSKDGHLIIYGGECSNGSASDEIFEFNFETGFWREIKFQGKVPNLSRLGHQSIFYEDSLFVFGGMNLVDFQYSKEDHYGNFIEFNLKSPYKILCNTKYQKLKDTRFKFK